MHFFGRYKLLASLRLAETKLEQWTVRYGKEGSIEALLADYIDFVDRQDMLKNFEKLQLELKTQAEKYKTGGAGKIVEFIEFNESFIDYILYIRSFIE